MNSGQVRWVMTAAVLVWVAAVLSSVIWAQRSLTDTGQLAAQVYRNTGVIESLSQRVSNLERWREGLDSAEAVSQGGQDQRITALEVTVNAHDRLIWIGAGTGLTALLVALLNLVLHRPEWMKKKDEEDKDHDSERGA